MPWGRLDDTFHSHPKVVGLSLEAVGLWTLCLSWVCEHTTNTPTPGLIPAGVVQRFAGRRSKKLTVELVDAGLWETVGPAVDKPVDGQVKSSYLVHDFATYLPDDKTRAVRSAAGKKGAQARWQKPGSEPVTSTSDSKEPSASHDVANASPSTSMANPMANEVANPIANDGSRARRTRAFPEPVPETIREPPVGAASPRAPTVTAQQIITEWVGTLRKRPPGQVIAHLGRIVKTLLAERIDPDDIRAGLTVWQRKGLHPSTFPTVVAEVMNRHPPGKSLAKPQPQQPFSTTDQRVSQALALADRLERQETPP